MKKCAGLFALSLLLLAGCAQENVPATEKAADHERAAAEKAAELPALADAAEAVFVNTDPVADPVAYVPAVEEAVALTPPPGEPSEAVLRALEFQRYAAIEKAGGLPVTITATGRQLVLKPKLYSVRKESCRPTPQAPAGWYECSLTIRLSLAADGSDPSEQGERIGVKWDGKKAEWVLQ